jgi:hypothetical protein
MKLIMSLFGAVLLWGATGCHDPHHYSGGAYYEYPQGYSGHHHRHGNYYNGYYGRNYGYYDSRYPYDRYYWDRYRYR